MTEKTLVDLNRRPINFAGDKVREVLPEYFVEEYPDLITFLEKYYDFMDSDQSVGFSEKIQTLYQIRDLQATDLDLLDDIFKEIGQNAISSSFFTKPRYIATLFAPFYLRKGSRYSAEQFFSALYGERPEVVYPKENLFIVGQSQIGPDSLRYIQDNGVYQILSILIKSSVPITVWRDIYKKFVHPAGFHLAGEVVLESTAENQLNPMPTVVLDDNAGVITVSAASVSSATSSTSIVGIYPDSLDSDSDAEVLQLNSSIGTYQTLTVADLDGMYSSIEEMIDINSPTFDEDSGGSVLAVRLSNETETFDEEDYNN